MKINLSAPEKNKIETALASDPVVSNLLSMRYDQIDAWVDSNINTLADVRAVFKRIIKIFIFLIRHLKVNIS